MIVFGADAVCVGTQIRKTARYCRPARFSTRGS